ncbi:MAG: hypothetical protein Q8T04_04960, partial [Bacteroidota bacterium]|nr:hypothetical protein [Bacteroidota bacterium]
FGVSLPAPLNQVVMYVLVLCFHLSEIVYCLKDDGRFMNVARTRKIFSFGANKRNTYSVIYRMS